MYEAKEYLSRKYSEFTESISLNEATSILNDISNNNFNNIPRIKLPGFLEVYCDNEKGVASLERISESQFKMILPSNYKVKYFEKFNENNESVGYIVLDHHYKIRSNNLSEVFGFKKVRVENQKYYNDLVFKAPYHTGYITRVPKEFMSREVIYTYLSDNIPVFRDYDNRKVFDINMLIEWRYFLNNIDYEKCDVYVRSLINSVNIHYDDDVDKEIIEDIKNKYSKYKKYNNKFSNNAEFKDIIKFIKKNGFPIYSPMATFIVNNNIVI